jgi:signal transduction histidine kinase
MLTAETVAAGSNEQIISLVAHELRFPLVPIRNAAALLRHKSPDAPTVRRAAAIIERQANAMSRLIGDLADVSRLQLGALQLHLARAPLIELIDCAVESIGPFANERGHVLSVSVSLEPVYLNMDVLRLCQALHHIIANAILYTDEHGHVHVRAQREGAQAVIVVSDTGIGISEDQLEAIFGLFVHSAQAGRIEPGLGLGLYLARHLIEAHGGAVTATSAGRGRGSEFTIRLPCEMPVTPRFSPTGEALAIDLTRA